MINLLFSAAIFDFFKFFYQKMFTTFVKKKEINSFCFVFVLYFFIKKPVLHFFKKCPIFC